MGKRHETWKNVIESEAKLLERTDLEQEAKVTKIKEIKEDVSNIQ
jgi:hypothetical protein